METPGCQLEFWQPAPVGGFHSGDEIMKVGGGAVARDEDVPHHRDPQEGLTPVPMRTLSDDIRDETTEPEEERDLEPDPTGPARGRIVEALVATRTAATWACQWSAWDCRWSRDSTLSQALPIYSRDLGSAAGDQLYQQGYFRQAIDGDGAPQALFPHDRAG